VWVHPKETVTDVAEAAVKIENAGVDELWIGDEGVSRDPFVLLTVCALQTQRLDLGLGVTNPVLRHPGVVAAAASTISELSDDRFILGWGSGGSDSLEPFGLRSTSPVETLSNAIEMTRNVHSGVASATYRPPIHAQPPRRVRQYIGARGPKLNTLASAIADGVFLSGIPATKLDHIVSCARSVRNIDIALYQTVHSSGRDSPDTVSGPARVVAERLAQLVERYKPHTIGIACVDDWDLGYKMNFCLEVFQQLELARERI
jgi:alkanesulfonate monooxygenase SsuD/methylene tetrahydromethanopterin reductase-like flavin-dependent oxidoreductase (luciferase family)